MSDNDNHGDDGDDGNDGNEQSRGALTTPTRAGQIARRDFSGQSLEIANPIAMAIATQERAMVEARYVMAMRRPRDIDDVRAMILAECKRPGFAEVATYARPVGSAKDENGVWKETFAEGLSIRFAEVALRRMGNMSCTARTIHDDAAVRMIQISAIDYESGGSWEQVITVAKTVESKSLRKGQRPLGERVNSYGDRVYIVEANEQRLAAKLGAEISKASRTAILRLVPGEIQDEAFDLCKQVAANRDAKDPAAAKKRVLDGFAEVAVRPSEVIAWLGHPVEQGTREEFKELSRILSGLRERELVWSELLAERLADRAKAKPATAAAPAPAAGAAATQATASSSAPGPDPQQAAAAAFVASAVGPIVSPAAKPPTTSGNGSRTAALKSAIGKTGTGGRAAAPPAKPAEDQREAEPAWMAKTGDPDRRIDTSDAPPEDAPREGMEYRHCAGTGCSATIEVAVATAAGQRCYACTAADRDAE